jgi:hypothetical protein
MPTANGASGAPTQGLPPNQDEEEILLRRALRKLVESRRTERLAVVVLLAIVVLTGVGLSIAAFVSNREIVFFGASGLTGLFATVLGRILLPGSG